MAAAASLTIFPLGVYADAIGKISFTTDAQSIAVGTSSSQITLETEDVNGVPVKGNTVCVQITSSSQSGEFSTNTTWGTDSIRTLSLTIASNQYRRNFYYRDGAAGSYSLSAKAAIKPGETCTTWSPDTGVQWTATQNIIIGSVSPPLNEESSTQTNTQTTTTTTPSPASAPVSSYVAPPEPQIFADGGENRTVIVAADTEFLARAYNRNKETISGNIRFSWNFGDGSTGEGQSVLHHFEYPGKYAVVLNIADNRDAASDRIIVTAEPAKLAFSTYPDGSIMIENHAGRDLNLSSWLVRSFGRVFMVPKDSIILAGETLRIGEKTLGFRSSAETELDYPNGVLALRAGTANEASDSVKANVAAASAVAKPRSIPVSAIVVQAEKERVVASIASDVSDVTLAMEEIATDSDDESGRSAQTASVEEPGSGGTGGYMWWLGALGLAVVGTGAVLASRRALKKEWDIIEEKEG
ncbi:MAG: PKD domain-containing protein [bacterium]|nr:PKD domain-containing protein [bacterium]